MMSWDSQGPCMCVCVCTCVRAYVRVGLQGRKFEGKGQSRWVRQRLSQTNEETPGIGREEGRWGQCRKVRTDKVSSFQGLLDVVDTLTWNCLHSFKTWLRCFHAWLWEEPSFPFMFIGSAQSVPHLSRLALSFQTSPPATLYMCGPAESQLIASALKMKTAHFFKHWLLPTSLHGKLTQKNTFRIMTAVKILNLTTQCLLMLFPYT
jgi:hypothetical protein